mgnify:CR=1 FL=1
MKFRNLFWGAFFILAAVAIILNQLGMLAGVSLLNLVITILLIPIIINSIKHINFSGIFIPLAIMGIMYADKLGIQKLTPFPILGSAIFLSIGLSFLIHPKQYKFEKEHKNKDFEDEETIEETNKGEVNIFAKFTGSIKYINSNDLEKINLKCSFGAMKVYFDNSGIKENEAIINLDVDFAGVELYVPKEWNVVDNVNSIFGGIEEKNNKGKTGEKTLILKGKVSFAGVEIIYI